MVDDNSGDNANVDLAAEVERLRAEAARGVERVRVLEDSLKADAVAAARRAVVAECVKGRPGLDVGRLAGLLERLAPQVEAVVDGGGRVAVPPEAVNRLRDGMRVILGAVGDGVVAPPVAPGEPPRRDGAGGGGVVQNCWDTTSSKDGAARGRDMIVKAARELERMGLL